MLLNLSRNTKHLRFFPLPANNLHPDRFAINSTNRQRQSASFSKISRNNQRVYCVIFLQSLFFSNLPRKHRSSRHNQAVHSFISIKNTLKLLFNQLFYLECSVIIPSFKFRFGYLRTSKNSS